MNFKTLSFWYGLFLIGLTIFSYGFVDPNLKLTLWPPLDRLAFRQPTLTTLVFIFFLIALFGFYLYFLKLAAKKKILPRQWSKLILATAFILLFSYPAFSYDIFNYIMTAKIVTFYHENPYLMMPIEFLNEPMLAFMHLANRLTPYPPLWISLTLIPSVLAKGSILISLFLFKLLMAVFYFGVVFLLGKILEEIEPQERRKGIVFFAFNPLILIEVLVSSHNDVVMMFFALLALYFLFQKRKTFAFFFLVISGGIKCVTFVLLPIFGFFSRFKKERLIFFSCWALFLVFLFSPLKRELYPWYLVWVIPFAALAVKKKFLFWLILAFSFGLLGRYLPFLYTRSWGGITPVIKKGLTLIPPAAVLLFFSLEKILKHESRL